MNDIGDFEVRATRQSKSLLRHAYLTAEKMQQRWFDPAHLVLAILERPADYSGFITVLEGFNLDRESLQYATEQAFSRREDQTAEPQRTDASRRMYILFGKVARVRHEKEGATGRLAITVYDMGAAAIMSKSVLVDRLVRQPGWKPSFMIN